MSVCVLVLQGLRAYLFISLCLSEVKCSGVMTIVCYLTHGEVWDLRAAHSSPLMSTNWPNTFPYQIVFESKTFSSPFRFMFVELKQKQKNDLRAKSLHFKHNPIQINERIQFIPLKIVIYFCVRLCWSLINERLNELILFPLLRSLHRWRLTWGHARLAGLLAPLIRIYGDQADIMGGNQEHSQLQARHVKALRASSGLDCHW